MVVTRPQRYRDSLQSHYTASTPIVSFMVSRLEPANGDVVWEPCAGKGDLIDGVLRTAPTAAIRASEINSEAITYLQSKYSDATSVDIHHEDALDVVGESLFEERASFTRIIANPPYGAYQTPERRRQLQRRFGKLYVRESYGVILYHALSLLEQHGRLVFIIPDTFLWLTRHEVLRRKLVSQTTIEEIALFPSKFFPNISFGYSGLCIITLTKRIPPPDHAVRVVTDFSDVSALTQCIAEPHDRWPCSITSIRQSDISARPHVELVLHNNGAGISLSQRANAALGDHADIRTGFYSGNDRRWVRKLSVSVPRSKAYEEVCSDQIANLPPSLKGFHGTRTFIPIVRGGAGAFIKPTQWFVDWSQTAISAYTRKGKNPARFQNSAFYFRDGIGIPMVASSRMTGALLENRLFDQGIVGVFPHNPNLKLFLLGFFNSSIATDLVRQINPTANNSANYIKRLPMVIPNANDLNVIEPLVCKAIGEAQEQGAVSDDVQQEIDSFYSRMWRLSEGAG